MIKSYFLSQSKQAFLVTTVAWNGEYRVFMIETYHTQLPVVVE